MDQNVNCIIYPVQVRVLADYSTTKRLAWLQQSLGGRCSGDRQGQTHRQGPGYRGPIHWIKELRLFPAGNEQ